MCSFTEQETFFIHKWSFFQKQVELTIYQREKKKKMPGHSLPILHFLHIEIYFELPRNWYTLAHTKRFVEEMCDIFVCRLFCFFKRIVRSTTKSKL